MDYEKAYKEALERAKLSRLQLLDIGEEATEIEYIFPELKESEDERIRKEIISYIKSSGAVTNSNWISWLEKQGEQKSSWSEEDEARLETTIKLIEENPYNSKQVVNGIVNWLKSIKPQKHWKPSEEQLRAIINSAQGLYQCKEKEVLLDLYEQLKNL
jgi:hypothetical protein